MRIGASNRVDKHAAAALKLRVIPALFALLAACTPSGPEVGLEGRDGRSVDVKVEIVSTPDSLRRGLMWRTELPSDHGMLFVFDDDAPRSFWMKNTPLPLDILFISSQSRVVSIAEDTIPYSLTSIASDEPAKYVLEVNSGFSRRHGIEAGSAVTLPPLAPAPKR